SAWKGDFLRQRSACGEFRVQLARAAGFRRCGELRGREAGRGRELAHAAGEIAQMQAQLIERKAEGEDALQLGVGQLPRHAFAAKRRELSGKALARGVGGLE